MKLPGALKILLFNESRKVGFGLWLFIVSCLFLVKGLIDGDKWMLCSGAASALIGGGTLADTWLGKKKGPNEPPPAQ